MNRKLAQFGKLALCAALLALGACSGPPVVINRAVAAKKVDTTEIRRAQAVTKQKLDSSAAHAEAAGVAVDAAEAILPAITADAVSVPMAAVTLSPEQVIAIHLDFTKARSEIFSLRGELKLAQDSAGTEREQRAQIQERADTLAASDAAKTVAINDASGALAKSEKEKATASGAKNLWMKLALFSWLAGGVYLFLRLSPWTRAFIP